MSNVTAMECTADRVWVRGADGREWVITRSGVQAIYQSKGGNAASRKAATITDVLAAMEAALGASQASALLASLDFDPANLSADMLLSLS